MKAPALISAVAFAAMMGTHAIPVAADDHDEVPMTLTGCVIAGQEKDTFVLTNVSIEGPSSIPSHAFYRFDKSKAFRDHVGHRVEVRGKADLDDVDKGRMKVRVKDDGSARTEIRSERQTVKVDHNVWVGTGGSMKLEADIPTYAFKVDKVSRLQGNCSSSPVAVAP